jgi:Domain of unknown function (DUF4832)/Domain of unknown function (DUF4874)
MMRIHTFIALIHLVVASMCTMVVNAREVTLLPSSEIIANPERGFYSAAGLDSGTLQSNAAAGIRLCINQIILEEFLATAITAARLDTVRQDFLRVRQAGLKCVVRVAYNNAANRPDAPLSIVQMHLAQLKPIFAEFDDICAFYQAGIIGSWGEWHDSTNLTTAADRQAVVTALLTAVPAGRFIQLRTPDFVNELNQGAVTLTSATAFQNTQRARLGHHNDCWRASATDLGTYSTNATIQEATKSFLASQTQFLPWGGETCALAAPYSDSVPSLAEAARFHATYLNKDYTAAVLGPWEGDGTMDVLRRQLGYRFELQSATLPDDCVIGTSYSYQIKLRNRGWAPVYNPRPTFLRVMAGDQIMCDVPIPNADPRFWSPEAGEILLQGAFVAPVNVPTQTLGFALWMPDANESLRARPEYAIRCANASVWSPDQGHNILFAGARTAANKVRIDGNFADWAGRPITSDPAGDHSTAVADYIEASVASDRDRLYLRLKFQQPTNWAGNFHNNLYVDTDNSGLTGYQGSGFGSELLIQSGVGYRQAVGNFNAGQVSCLDFRIAPTGIASEIEISVSRDAAFGGQPIFARTGSIALLLTSENSSGVLQERLPNAPGQLSYTWPIPAPVSALTSNWNATQGFALTGGGSSNTFYQVSWSATLAGDWKPAAVALTDAQNHFYFLDPAATTARRRFYRITEVP